MPPLRHGRATQRAHCPRAARAATRRKMRCSPQGSVPRGAPGIGLQCWWCRVAALVAHGAAATVARSCSLEHMGLQPRWYCMGLAADLRYHCATTAARLVRYVVRPHEVHLPPRLDVPRRPCRRDGQLRLRLSIGGRDRAAPCAARQGAALLPCTAPQHLRPRLRLTPRPLLRRHLRLERRLLPRRLLRVALRPLLLRQPRPLLHRQLRLVLGVALAVVLGAPRLVLF